VSRLRCKTSNLQQGEAALVIVVRLGSALHRVCSLLVLDVQLRFVLMPARDLNQDVSCEVHISHNVPDPCL
jgi:hypothetical protein